LKREGQPEQMKPPPSYIQKHRRIIAYIDPRQRKVDRDQQQTGPPPMLGEKTPDVGRVEEESRTIVANRSD